MSQEQKPIPHAERLKSGVIGEEARMIEAMIRSYCKKFHHTENNELCKECSDLLYYAKKRLACCPFQEKKSTCARCTIHCYRNKEREMIRDVMRTTGPSTLLKHPVMTLNHFIRSLKTPPEKPRNIHK